jgi:hypothetical protein
VAMWKMSLGGCRALLAATTMALFLAACGGGGGGDAGSAAILDSFGQPVGSDAGIGDGDSGADGTAGEGKPIVGGTVLITDATGKTASATTNAQGYYRVEVTGFKAPFVAKVTAPGGKVYHSLNVKEVVRNGFITINISGLTDVVASDVAKAGGKSGAADLTPAIVSANGAAMTASIKKLQDQLAAVIRDAGIDPATFDPIAVPFKADHTGYDKVLDNVVVTIQPDGSTGVAISPTFPGTGGGTPGTLTGTWEMKLNFDGQTFVAGQIPGSSVPTQTMLSQLNTEMLVGQLTAAEVAQGMTVSGSGNTFTLTGPNTNYTFTINSFSFTNYQGCGTCGVGSSVTYTVTFNITEGGLLEGVQEPQTTTDGSYSFTYTRVN